MYLMRRPENGMWYFRRPIPKELQPFVVCGNKQTFTVSLRTKNLAEARRMHHEHWMESERVFDEARSRAKAGVTVGSAKNGGKSPTAKQVVARRPVHQFTKSELLALVQRWFLAEQETSLARHRNLFNFSDSDERKQALASLASELAILELRDGAQMDFLTSVAKKKIVEDAGGIVTLVHPGTFTETHFWFTAIVRESLIMLNRFATGILEKGTPPQLDALSPELSGITLRKEAATSLVSAVTLRDLIERHEKDPNRQHVKAKTRDETKLVYSMLTEALGETTSLASITREKIKELQDLYRNLPAHFTRLYPNKTLRQAAELAKRDGRPPMERATFNKRMTLLSGVFRYAVREQLMQSSPAEGLTLREKKKAEGQKSFTSEQLRLIFEGPLFQAFAREPNARLSPNHRLQPHQFWTPLLALFQGFRMEEILQLSPDDIAREDGTHCIHIREGEEQSVKTEASLRVVPLHPMLARFGFLRYVQAARDAQLKELFPDAKRGRTYGNRSHNYSKRFSRYLADVGVKEGRNQVFHSFRHTFTDGLRICDVPEDVRRRLGGWTDRTSLESSYGGRVLPLLAKHLAKLKYPGLNLSHLMPR